MRRAEHAGWDPKLRQEKPLDLLHRAEKGRVPKLIQLKHERMAVSPFAFFRGAVPVMAYDLSLGANTEILNQICGDAHVRNLGAFAALDGRINFDINDFDETVRAPFEWDVKRMATSLILAGRDAGIRDGQSFAAAAAMLERYRESIHLFAHMPLLEAARFQVHRLGDVTPIAEILRAAERATPMHNLTALTVPNAGAKPPAPARVFKAEPPVLTPVSDADRNAVLAALPAYLESLQPERRHLFERYTFLDVCFKVVGTGSVGLRDYCLYLQGNGERDPLFLQIKEEAASAYTPYLGDAAPHPVHQGRRTVEGERAMQFQSDPFLGWTQIDGRDYMVRQLNDHKASINLATLKSASLLAYAEVCGELLARGHARSGDATVLAGYLGQSDRFDQAVLKYAEAYADQTEADWKLLKKAKA
ncbi:DUF2252 domain-containing protein [Granulicella rosea]|nr:DUF2252 domain-containing protein [Granulicella rosea]